jgi:acyl-CoA reductase-like NAD-dependent aldehyde dehydrogenase
MLVATPEAVTAALGAAAAECVSAATDMMRSPSDAVFVADSVGLNRTLAGAASLRLFHSGQRAGQSARIYVEQGMANGLADKFHEYLAFLECGDPRKSATDLGPLRSSAALQRVESQVARALKHGALLKMGGRRYQPWGLVGYFFQPTLMIEGRGEERVPEEEIRGPVVIVSPVRSLAEALSQERIARVAFFGNDLDSQLRLLTAAGVDFAVANLESSLDRTLDRFRNVPQGSVRIDIVTTDQSSWFPYGAREALP